MGLPEIPGRYVIPPVILIIIVIIIGGSFGTPRYTNTPGPITGDQSSGINGTYRVEKGRVLDLSSDPDKHYLLFTGIESDPAGGACIVFRAEDIVGADFAKMASKTCANDDECAVCPSGKTCPPDDTTGGYCDVTTQKCWARPDGHDDLLCRKSIDPDGAITVGTDMKVNPDGDISLAGMGIRPNAEARVLARLLCSGGKPCASKGQTSVLKWGTPKQL